MSTLKVDGIRSNSASSDAITLASDGTCTANITNNLSNRNVIKNSAMLIAQRGYSFSNVTSSAYHLDQFYLYLQNTSAAFAVSQNTDSPDGFGQSLKIDVSTADTSIASNEEIRVIHKLEGFDVQRFMKGSSDAKRFTLSFYVKATKTGVYCVKLYDRDNNRDVSGSYTVSDTNWNRYTIDFPADTTGAFDNDNASSLEITWWLVAGSAVQGGTLNTAWRSNADASSATGQVNFADSTSNDWLLTGVQLEATDNGKATDFEHPRSFGDELARCQRYYFNIEGDNDDMAGCSGYAVWHDVHWFQVIFPVPMRTIPSYTGSATAGRLYAHNSGNTFNFNQLTLKTNSNDTTHKSCQLINNGVSGGSEDGLGGELNFQADNGKLEFSAEL